MDDKCQGNLQPIYPGNAREKGLTQIAGIITAAPPLAEPKQSRKGEAPLRSGAS